MSERPQYNYTKNKGKFQSGSPYIFRKRANTEILDIWEKTRDTANLRTKNQSEKDFIHNELKRTCIYEQSETPKKPVVRVNIELFGLNIISFIYFHPVIIILLIHFLFTLTYIYCCCAPMNQPTMSDISLLYIQ